MVADTIPGEFSPLPTTREERGRQIAQLGGIRALGARYVVPSQSARADAPPTYLVDLVEQTCTCPDFELRRLVCKHQEAVLFWLAWEGVVGVNEDTGKVVLPKKRKTYKQNWPAYNAAQIHEKEHVEVLLRALCEGIEQPPRKPGAGRNPIPLRDAVFAMVMKVYTTLSGRRASTDIERYVAMGDDDLLRATEVCLRNLERLDDLAASGPDGDLQLVLVPELWERIRPATRDGLRRISSTLAEYRPDPARPSFFARLLAPETMEHLRERADDLRRRVEMVTRLDVRALVEQVRFAIAGSRAGDRWSPSDCVYEPGFVYRLVPAVAWRALVRGRTAAIRSGRLAWVDGRPRRDPPPTWQRDHRVHGYWLDGQRVGHVGLSPRGLPPVVYTWAIDAAQGRSTRPRGDRRSATPAARRRRSGPRSAGSRLRSAGGVEVLQSIEVESADRGAAVAVAKDVYEEGKRVFRTNLPRDLYEACGRAFGTTRDDAKKRLLVAMYGTDKKRLDGRKDKSPELLSKEPAQATLYSPRGIPLVWGGGHPKVGAVLTVECYCKWYELFLVCPDAIVGIDFGVLGQHSKDESPYCDHAPNPRAVYRYAQARGYQLDNAVLEMIIGRWEIEYHENYDVEQEDDRDV